jgi:hypothetical protein
MNPRGGFTVPIFVGFFLEKFDANQTNFVKYCTKESLWISKSQFSDNPSLPADKLMVG